MGGSLDFQAVTYTAFLVRNIVLPLQLTLSGPASAPWG